MILGTGVDVVAVERIARAIARHGERFLRRVYTDGERRTCATRPIPEQSFAARFAAKEAALKALGGAGVRWRDLEVTRGERGAPSLAVHGRAAEIARGRGIERFHLSLAHDGPLAIAFVVAEGGGP